MKSNLTRRKNGSYILKHKAPKFKKGKCKECNQTDKDSDFGLLYRHVSADMMMVKTYLEEHLIEYPKHKSITPNWCGTCKALVDYTVEVDINKTLGYYEKSN
jgi:hypothetical protein|tara:strand:- start:119 stop:424 length:306 start_codon:yes stop_codon:yes gene_type:complete